MFCADFYTRLTYRRWIGFSGFQTNKAYAVSEAVPAGRLWVLFALSAFHSAAAQRIIHLFAVPPGDAGNLQNATADVVSPHFLGTVNNPPLKSGVLISVGGGTGLPDMQSVGVSSVSGMNLPIFFLPERWKILASIDSNEAVTGAGFPDGITIDAALIEVTPDEEIPEP
jgi:hypothetical protein